MHLNIEARQKLDKKHKNARWILQYITLRILFYLMSLMVSNFRI